MYWIQESDCKVKNRRMYHCDYTSDIAKLPTNTAEGDREAAADEESYSLATYGDRCLCLEDSTYYELRNEPNDWKKL